MQVAQHRRHEAHNGCNAAAVVEQRLLGALCTRLNQLLLLVLQLAQLGGGLGVLIWQHQHGHGFRQQGTCRCQVRSVLDLCLEGRRGPSVHASKSVGGVASFGPPPPPKKKRKKV